MQVEYLRNLAIECKDNPNYQFRDASWAEIDKMAALSFEKLTKEQQLKVVQACHKYGLFDSASEEGKQNQLFEEDNTDDNKLKEVLRWRFLAQTNLFFLCKLLEKYKDVSKKEYVLNGQTHNVHEEICNAFFVRKNPTVPTFKKFATDYIGLKERLLLVPRGGFKSSMDMADTVQWIICFPEVTILILTGVLDLAKDFVKEIKSHFELEDSEEADKGLYSSKKGLRPRTMPDGSRNLFQVLFAEHCIPKEEGKATEFQTPAASMIDKECTVFAASIDQNLSGWHVGVMKLDDVVTNENSKTVDRIKGVNKQVSINKAMLHPYGFYDKIGTWYDQEDTYGQDIKNEAKREKANHPPKMDIYLRAAWWPNEAAEKAGKIDEEMTQADYVLWFEKDDSDTPQLTYEKLLNEKMDDFEGFAIKYLNDPMQAHRVKFPRELLIRRTIPNTQLPQQGMIVVCVDTAYSVKSWADYTVIIVSLIYGGRFYVIDMKRGRWNEYELPAVIAAAANQWKPRRISIEESVGVKWLGREIYREMDKLKIRVPIEFVSLGKGSKKTAKDWKAKPVLRLLGDERLLFAYSCPGLEDLYSELEKFGTAASTHDDIVSALSILVEQYASYAEIEGRRAAAQFDFVPDPMQKQYYDQVYGSAMNVIEEKLSITEYIETFNDSPSNSVIEDDHLSALGELMG